MTDRDEQTYKNIISNLIDGMACNDCPYRDDCVSLKMSEWEAIDYPCSKLMFMTERKREENGSKN
mgnify:FL=1